MLVYALLLCSPTPPALPPTPPAAPGVFVCQAHDAEVQRLQRELTELQARLDRLAQSPRPSTCPPMPCVPAQQPASPVLFPGCETTGVPVLRYEVLPGPLPPAPDAFDPPPGRAGCQYAATPVLMGSASRSLPLPAPSCDVAPAAWAQASPPADRPADAKKLAEECLAAVFAGDEARLAKMASDGFSTTPDFSKATGREAIKDIVKEVRLSPPFAVVQVFPYKFTRYLTQEGKLSGGRSSAALLQVLEQDDGKPQVYIAECECSAAGEGQLSHVHLAVVVTRRDGQVKVAHIATATMFK